MFVVWIVWFFLSPFSVYGALPLPPELIVHQCHIPIILPLSQIGRAVGDDNQNLIEHNIIPPTGPDFCEPHARRDGGNDRVSGAAETSSAWQKWESAAVQLEAAFSLFAAAQIAIDHLFTNDGSVVSELASPDMQRCVLPFDRKSLVLYNSDYIRQGDAQKIMDTDGVCHRAAQKDWQLAFDIPISLCAAVIRLDNDAFEAFLAAARVVQLPVLGFASTVPKVTSQYFNVVARNGPTLERMATALVNYLEWIDRRAVAVLHDESSFGSSFADVLLGRTSTTVVEKQTVQHRGFHAESIGDHGLADELDGETDDYRQHEIGDESLFERIRSGLQRIQFGGYRTVFVAFDSPAAIPLLARMALELDMVGPDYVWFFGDQTIPTHYAPQERTESDHAVFRLLQGSGVLHVLDGFSFRRGDEGKGEEEDAFLKAWRQQDSTMVERVHENLISYLHRDDGHRPGGTASSSSCLPFRAGPDYFQTHLPVQYTSYVYDSVVAAGIAMCQISLELSVHPDFFSLSYEQLENAWNAFLPTLFKNSSAFEGASGSVRFDDTSLSRDSTTFGMYNVQLKDNSIEASTHSIQVDEKDPRRLKMVLTARTTLGQEHLDGSTKGNSDWESVETFRYADGVSTPPPGGSELRVQNQRYLSSGVRMMGLILMTSSLVLSGLMAIYIFTSQEEQNIRRAQPQFLLVLCFGSMISVSSIVPLSYDENHGWTRTDLDHGCLAVPWLFFIGYNCSYLALFSKLWRINRLLQFSRRTVTIRQVLLPFAFLVFLAIVCLTSWTVLDGFHWTRNIVSTIPLETMGKCHNEWHTLARFFVPLCLLTIASTVLTANMAWRTRDVATELCESKPIFFAILVQLQTWLVSVPVIIVLEDGGSRDASFLGYVTLIWSFNVSMVLLVVGPRVAKSIQDRFAKSRNHSRRPSLRGNIWVTFGAAGISDSRTKATAAATH